MSSGARRALAAAARRNPLPGGTLLVAMGLGVSGVATYVFLARASRALGADAYAPLAALWTIVVFTGPGCFLPLEQEVARALASRRAAGLGGRPVVARALAAGAGALAVLAGLSLTVGRPVLDRLLDGDRTLEVGFVLALLGFGMGHLTRGILAGNGRFGRYGVFLAVEGLLRAGGVVLLAGLGVHVAGTLGLVIGAGSVLAVVAALAGARRLADPGPPAPWGELSSSLGVLLTGSLLAQFLVNSGPIAVKLLSPEGAGAAAGRFLDGLVIARIPLFFFQAVQASLLPSLSALAAAGRHAEFRRSIGRVVALLGGLGSTATVAALAVGPWVVRLLFGPGFDLGRADLGYLAAASGLYMVALGIAQALIALHHQADCLLAWTLAAAVLVVAVLVPGDVLPRVEHAFLGGTGAAAVAMGILLLRRLAGLDATPGRAHSTPDGAQDTV